MFKVQPAPTLLNTEYPVPPPAMKQLFRSYHIKQDSSSSLLVDNIDSPSIPGAPGGSDAAKPIISSSPDSSSGYSSSMRSTSCSPASSRATSPPAKDRASTPLTPNDSTEYYKEPTSTLDPSASSSNLSTKTVAQPIPRKSSTIISTNQDDFLHLMEPGPVFPPTYESLPPGGCPRYPIMPNEPFQDCTPAYSPSIFKIGVVSRKLEWLTPYEPAPARSWKHVIMELNSTQLNFYQIPATLEAHILQFKAISQSPDRAHNEHEEKELKDLNSCFTSDADLQFYKFCKRLHLLNDVTAATLIDDEIDSKVAKKLNSKRLLRSYSLQRSRVGLAIDYKKRPNVLRMRVESEQLLINFQSTKDLIEWNMAIGVGRDVSLDLNERELPRFRTVPRRRRRNRAGSLPVTPSSLNLLSRDNEQRNRNRSNSEPNSSFKGKLSKLKLKLSSSSKSTSNEPMVNSKNLGAKTRSQSFNINSSSSARMSSLEMARLNLSPTQVSVFDELARDDSADDGFNYDVDVDDDDEDDEYYDDEEAIELVARNSILTNNIDANNSKNINLPKQALISSSSTQSTNNRRLQPPTSPTPHLRANEYEEDDVENMSDLHQSDDEEDEEDDDVVLADEDVFPDANGSPIQALKTSSRDHKWEPVDTRVHSKRKFYRNCLRCIKPLTMDDTWVNKSLCRPTTLSPLNFNFLRAKYNNTPICGPQSTFSSFFSNSSSSSSLTSMNSIAASTASTGGGFRKRSFSFKEINGFSLPDSALTKVPNHFLKEYIVGSHGLIPKEV